MLAVQSATLLGVLWVGVGVEKQATLTKQLMAEERPVTTVIHWASGDTTEVYTPRRPDEGIESLTARHNEEVGYVKAHPPVGESLP